MVLQYPDNLATDNMLNKIFLKNISKYCWVESKERIKSSEAKNEPRAGIQRGELTLNLAAALRHRLNLYDLELLVW